MMEAGLTPLKGTRVRRAFWLVASIPVGVRGGQAEGVCCGDGVGGHAAGPPSDLSSLSGAPAPCHAP